RWPRLQALDDQRAILVARRPGACDAPGRLGTAQPHPPGRTAAHARRCDRSVPRFALAPALVTGTLTPITAHDGRAPCAACRLVVRSPSGSMGRASLAARGHRRRI